MAPYSLSDAFALLTHTLVYGGVLSKTDLLAEAVSIAQDLVDLESEEPVSPYLAPTTLEREIDFALGQPVAHDDLMGLLRRVVETTPRTGSARFFNQLFGGRDDVATAAEVLSVMLNSSMYTFKVAGPHALIERELVQHMTEKLGWKSGDGTFTPGGSMSNLVAMIVARNRAFPEARDRGLGATPMAIYTSADSHYSITKAASVAGIGRDSVRAIGVDPNGRMDVALLRAAIVEDRAAGRLPLMVNATAATTVLGAFDPLPEIGRIASEEGLWFHVDGALGASIVLSERHGSLLAGIEAADSVTWNAHKLLGVPLICSALLVRDGEVLKENFNQAATYLFQSDEDDLNLGTKTMQCGRRNDAFKLWAAWKHHGDAGYAAKIDKLFALAAHARDIVVSDPDMVLTQEPPSVTVCFEVKGNDSATICESLLHQERAVVGYAEVDGRRVVRLACVNAALDFADVDAFFDEVREVSSARSPAVA